MLLLPAVATAGTALPDAALRNMAYQGVLEQPANVATTLLGDRFQIMRFAVEKGRVVVEAVVAGPDDPMCCPTQKLRRTLVLDGTSLTARDEPLGSVSLADLGRSSWRLTRIDGAP